MNSKDKIRIALCSKAQFLIMEGDSKRILTEVEDFYQKKDILLSLIESRNLKADNTRAFVSELSKKSYSDEVYIIRGFQDIEAISQNILLKSLENLANKKRIIAICDHTAGVLDTVISRAYHLYISPTKEQNDRLSEAEDLIFVNKRKTERLSLFFDRIDEDNILNYSYSPDTDHGVENLSKKLKVDGFVLEYFKRIEANCNKDLCADLLIYKILEDR
ncbi:MAG: hypothetical protein Q4A75_00425 [Peptostreptococcaceae bacterium]|nr:hypothetical protein [Peptostreptococcaceae bacterium]